MIGSFPRSRMNAVHFQSPSISLAVMNILCWLIIHVLKLITNKHSLWPRLIFLWLGCWCFSICMQHCENKLLYNNCNISSWCYTDLVTKPMLLCCCFLLRWALKKKKSSPYCFESHFLHSYRQNCSIRRGRVINCTLGKTVDPHPLT